MTGRAILAGLTLAALCAPAMAGAEVVENGGIGSQPADTAEIVAGAGDCARFVRHHGQVDFNGLKAAGWLFGGKQEVPAGVTGPANTATILGKGNVMLIVRHTGISATCQVTGRVDDLAREGEVRSGIAAALGAKPAKDYKGDDAFKATVGGRDGKLLDKLLISDEDRITVMSSENGGIKVVSAIVLPRILD